MKTLLLLLLTGSLAGAGTSTNNVTTTHPLHTTKGGARHQRQHKKPSHPPAEKSGPARSPRHTSAT